LRRVCVVGCGPAGVEAALAGVREGARVTLFEGSPRLPTPRQDWLGLLEDSAPTRSETGAALTRSGVDLRCDQMVSSVGDDLAVVSRSGRHFFDSVVVSAGTACVPVALPGCGKSGVHVLASEDSYTELRDCCFRYSKVLLGGTGSTALGVAHWLVRKGVQVTVVAPGGILPSRFCSLVRGHVLKAASRLGVSIQSSPILKAMGVDRVEAALVGGEVHLCDAIVIVPSRVPHVPSVPAETGPSGGILVEPSMISSVPNLYAAGGCAERVAGGVSISLMSGTTARTSGAVAGSNAAGGCAFMAAVGVLSGRILGLSVALAGLSLREARAAGYEALESSSGPDERSGCSIVFEVRSRRILGVQSVSSEDGPSPELFALMVSKGVVLGDLTSLDHSGSNDISPILEAASEGMRLWQRS